MLPIDELRAHLDDIERRQKNECEESGDQPEGPGMMRAKARRPIEECNRQTARGMLDDLIGRLERKLVCLRKLSSSLPLVLPEMADEALSDMIRRVRD